MRGMRLRMLVVVAVALSLGSACGPVKQKVDAGPDTSCGLDCAAQAYFGIVLNRCFEYSTDPLTAQTPPSLGVWVRDTRDPMTGKMFELEGGIQVIPVEYRQGGQIIQTDYFTFNGGDLTLMRRIAGTQSVTYQIGRAHV